MTELNKMYPGVANSVETFLTQPLSIDGTVLYVADGSVFGQLPNLAVLGSDQTAETILVKSKRSDGGFDVDRAFEGSKKRWDKATTAARNFTNYDYKQIVDNINKLDKGKADAIPGKQLSTNDYTKEDKDKIANILDKQYLYDILFGEKLVTRKEGEWPVVHGKPETIEARAFAKNQLVDVTIPLGVSFIENNAFMGNVLRSVVIPLTVVKIDVMAFKDNDLMSVTFQGPFGNIESEAFRDNALTEVRIPQAFTVASDAFDDDVKIIRY